MDEIFDQADPFGSWWPYILAVAVGVAMTIRTFMGGQRCPSTNQIERKVVIITGGYTGIGKELTKALAERGAEVIIAVKDMKKAEVMCDIMKRELKCKSNIDAKIIPKYLDLRSFDNVKSFAEDICKEYPIIDILINNAGIIFPFKTRNLYTKSVDGYEMHLQVNYLAPQLLTHLLLPNIRKAENGRIINISGHAHVAAKMDIDDPLNIGPYSTKFHDRDSFAHSKLAVILGTKWMARELKGTDVTVNCFTPGLVRGTEHLRNSPLMSSICVKFMTFPWMWLFMKTPFDGAQCGIYLAIEPKLRTISGEYFNDCLITQPSELGRDSQLAKKLYHETIKVLKLDKIEKDEDSE